MQMLNDLDKSNEAMQTFYALFTQSKETPKQSLTGERTSIKLTLKTDFLPQTFKAKGKNCI